MFTVQGFYHGSRYGHRGTFATLVDATNAAIDLARSLPFVSWEIIDTETGIAAR